MTVYKNSIDNLIDLLTDIKKACGGDIPVQVNIIGSDHVTGLHSICLDNDEGNTEAILYLETDPLCDICPPVFNFYTQGEDL